MMYHIINKLVILQKSIVFGCFLDTQVTQQSHVCLFCDVSLLQFLALFLFVFKCMYIIYV